MADVSYDMDALVKALEKKSQVRKPMKLVVLRGRYDLPVPDLATGFFDPADRTKIKLDISKWEPCGILTKDGISRDNKVKTEEEDGFNYIDPVREDIISADRTMSFTLKQDFTRLAMEMQRGMSLTGVTPDAKGNIAFDEPSIPMFPFHRYLAISYDYFMSDIAKPIFEVLLFMAVKQNDFSKMARAAGKAQETEFTGRVYTDEVYGTPVRTWIGGVGYDAAAHGFTTVPAG